MDKHRTFRYFLVLTYLNVILKYTGCTHRWNYIVHHQFAVAGQEITFLMQLLDSGFILCHILFKGEYIVLHEIVQD